MDLPVDLTRATDTDCSSFGWYRLRTGSSCYHSKSPWDTMNVHKQTVTACCSNRLLLCFAVTRSWPAHPSVFCKLVLVFVETTVTSSSRARTSAAGSASLTKPMHCWCEGGSKGMPLHELRRSSCLRICLNVRQIYRVHWARPSHRRVHTDLQGPIYTHMYGQI